MSGFGDVLEALLLGHTLCGSHISSTIGPGMATILSHTTTRYLGLMTTYPGTIDGSEVRTSFLEACSTAAGATAGGYARQPLVCTSPTSLTNTCANSGVITFPEVPSSASWGAIAYIGIYDTIGPATGHLLYYATLTNTRDVSGGDTLQIAAGALTIQLL